MGTDINFRKHLNRTYGTNVSLAFDPASYAYFAATGITGATQQAAIDNLVKGLKADGLWSKMKAVYPFVTDNRNQAPYSNGLNGGNYQTDGTCTLTFNASTAPDGTNTATRVLGVSAINYIYNSQVSSNNWGTGNRVLSIYLKAGSDNQVSIAITSDGSTTTTVCNLTSSWQRFEVTRNVVSTGGTYNISISGIDQTKDIYMWGIQFENGTTATTYQPIATTPQAFIAAQFKYNLVNPVDSDAAFRLVFNGGWTHSANGATPNGTNGYANTYLVPNTSIPSINSAHISFYSRTNSDSACDIGAGTAIPTSAFQVWPKQSNLRYVRVFSNFTAESTTESTAAFYLNSRLNSTNVTGYRNGAVLTTLALNSVSTITNSIVISARSDGGTISSYSNRQAAFATIGDGLLDSEATALYNRVQNFQLALNRAV